MTTPDGSAKTIIICFNRVEYLIKHRLHLVDRLLAEGWQVVVIGGGSRSEFDILEHHGAIVHPIVVESYRLKPFSDARLILQLRRLFAQYPNALLNVYSIKMMAAVQLAVRTMGTRRQPIGVVHSFAGLGRLFSPQSNLHKRVFQYFFLSLIKRQAGRGKQILTTETNADRDTLIRRTGLAQTSIVVTRGAGINLDRFRNDECEKPVPRSEETKSLTFLLAGRLLRSKGVEAYLEAAAAHLKNHPNDRFLVAGSPEPADPDSIDPALLAPDKLCKNLEYLGALSADDMPRLLGKTDVACLPSNYPEGIPRILIEACASGCTFIATEIPGWIEVVGREQVCGLIISETSVAALNKAFNTLTSDRYYTRTLAKTAYETLVKSGLDEGSVQERMLSAYHLAMGENAHDHRRPADAKS